MARTLRCEVDSLEQNLLLHYRHGLPTPRQLAYRQTQRLNYDLTTAGYRVGLRNFPESEGVRITFKDKNICFSSCKGTGLARSVALATESDHNS